MKRLILALSCLAFACGRPSPPIPSRAIELRNLGLAQLENEEPAKAEETFRELLQLLPHDPLAEANLAVSLLRQQRSDEALQLIDQALEEWPARSDLRAIRGDILQWSGQPEAALAAYRAAAEADPRDPELLYALYRQAASMEGPQAVTASAWSTAQLTRLRPENVVVLLARSRQALVENDRGAASTALLRIRELLWQAPEASERAMQAVLNALEAGDLDTSRTALLRLENVLKVSPMYRESLRELMTGIQGIPVARFASEPLASDFGSPLVVSFSATPLAPQPGAGLVTADLDGDEVPDAAYLLADDHPRLQLRLSSTASPAELPLTSSLRGLALTDLDNDGIADLLGYGAEQVVYWRGDGAGRFEETTAALGLGPFGATAVTSMDFDIEGDLDLVLAASSGLELLRNNLQGPLQPAGDRVLPDLGVGPVHGLVSSDLDRDGDLDLLVAHDEGLTWLDNLRQGRFEDRTEAAGLAGGSPVVAVTSADLDRDGLPDLVAAGAQLRLLRNRDGRFEAGEILAEGPFEAVLAFDADNDGRLDIAAAGPSRILVLQQNENGFTPLEITAAPPSGSDLAALDDDGDGDLDLLIHGTAGLHRLENRGSEGRSWLSLRLRGLDQGNSKNNLLGLGSTVEVFAGDAYQFREVTGEVTHLGLGDAAAADVLRVVWTNGVPQNRLGVAGRQRIVEEQVLKGSCPFLYAWDGESMAFVTDLLWGAPLGMPLAPGVWAGADPRELVRVDGAVPLHGHYELRVTEELWEAAFFDLTRLWVVDHPAAVEVASSLRILPGEEVEERVLASRELRPVAAAWDGQGREVSARVRSRDEVYADGYRPSPYQGVAAEPWSFSFDLGAAPSRSVRLHLDGWIFPADASLNLALAQRTDLRWMPPQLEVETAEGWQVLMPRMGFPAGKTKTMVIDTPPLPAGARKLRIVSTQWLAWDRLAWSLEPADGEPRLVARLAPGRADLRYRGFSEVRRTAPNGPHSFLYDRLQPSSPWMPFPGSYTRFGDVRELLIEADDRSVVLAAGDEIVLSFDASRLEPPPAGWHRTVFLESHGWDKDADRNTYAAQQVEPLPFRSMSGYPFGPEEVPPDFLEDYRRRWLTRRVPAQPR